MQDELREKLSKRSIEVRDKVTMAEVKPASYDLELIERTISLAETLVLNSKSMGDEDARRALALLNTNDRFLESDDEEMKREYRALLITILDSFEKVLIEKGILLGTLDDMPKVQI